MSDPTEDVDVLGTTINLALTREDLALVCEALDSHVYWQLSDVRYRRDGYVNDPGSDDLENARQIVDAHRLSDRLDLVLRGATKS